MYRPVDVLTFALDRKTSRTISADGHLHVEDTPISKAVINDYWGREIPDYERLGLQADQMYSLLRDPDELAKAAKTFNGKPILREHMPVTSDDYPQDLVIGTTGSDTKFDGELLRSSISLWPGQDIRDVESGAKKQLSAGYRYRADMRPGVYKGKRYDGVMRDIKGNHVAVVKEGRAGPDVMVQDEAFVSMTSLFPEHVGYGRLFGSK